MDEEMTVRSDTGWQFDLAERLTPVGVDTYPQDAPVAGIGAGGGTMLLLENVRSGPQTLAEPVRDLQHHPPAVWQVSKSFEGEGLGTVPSTRNEERQADEFAERLADFMGDVGDDV
jgi:hypothetical protein